MFKRFTTLASLSLALLFFFSNATYAATTFSADVTLHKTQHTNFSTSLPLDKGEKFTLSASNDSHFRGVTWTLYKDGEVLSYGYLFPQDSLDLVKVASSGDYSLALACNGVGCSATAKLTVEREDANDGSDGNDSTDGNDGSNDGGCK